MWTRKSGLARKVLRMRPAFQHVLPVNTTGLGSLYGEGRRVIAEAVNVISLEAFNGLLQLFVILRGDAIPLTLAERTNATRVVQPLSPYAIKALFDAPRIIVLGKHRCLFNLNVGPTTSVLLDTLYCDDRLRLGMGGTSGSRFVFRRCPTDDQEQAREFQPLLETPPMNKGKVLTVLGVMTTLGLTGMIRGVARIGSGLLATVALALAAILSFGRGGIERNDMGVVLRREGSSDVAPAGDAAFPQ